MHNLISTCLLVKNEEKNIEDCLKSIIKISNEIIVVDNGSTDKTVDICQKYNCTVIRKEHGTESELRNEYINLAKNPWIFVIDADERLDHSSEIIDQYILSGDADIYRFPVNNYYGKGKWCTFITGRLFRNKNIFYKGEVHCTLSYSGEYKFSFIPVVIHHLDSLIKGRNCGKREKYIENLINQISNPEYENQKMRLINYLGVEYAALSNYEESKTCFMKVFNDGGFYKDLAAVYYAQVCIKNNEITAAKDMISKLVLKKYKDTNKSLVIGKDTISSLTKDLFQRCCILLSEISVKEQKYDEALYWCDEAIKYWPFAAQHHLNKALILKKMGDKNWKREKEEAYKLNKYLDKDIIYKEGSKINIYEFQSSLLNDISEVLAFKKELMR